MEGLDWEHAWPTPMSVSGRPHGVAVSWKILDHCNNTFHLVKDIVETPRTGECTCSQPGPSMLALQECISLTSAPSSALVPVGLGVSYPR